MKQEVNTKLAMSSLDKFHGTVNTLASGDRIKEHEDLIEKVRNAWEKYELRRDQGAADDLNELLGFT